MPPMTLPMSRTDDGPQRIGTEDDGECSVDDGGDLGIGAEPQRELGTCGAVTFIVRHHFDGSFLDPRIG